MGACGSACMYLCTCMDMVSHGHTQMHTVAQYAETVRKMPAKSAMMVTRARATAAATRARSSPATYVHRPHPG
jgi:hypothetical protein